MHKNYEKLFAHLKPLEPPEGLFEKIVYCLREEQRFLNVKRRLVIFSIGLIGSVAAFIPVFKMVRTEFVESGFIQFFSLLFSDFGIVISYWQNFAMTLLETLPITSLILLLAVVLVFLESLKSLVKNIKIIFTSKQLINT
jgi:ABC-type phosphate/phosphonate transport system permease subunit